MTGKRIGIVRSVLLTLAVLAATSGVVSAQGARTWRHGIIEAKSDAGILYMASERDYAKRLGLKLEFIQVKTDAMGLKALLSGELDSYEGGAGGAIAAAARGADIKILGCHWLTVPHGVFARGNISSMFDLKGKSVAISSPGTFPEMVAKAAFAKAGIPISEIKLAAMGSDTDRYKALIAGAVDAAIITHEFLPFAAKQGIKQLMSGAEAAPNFVRLCLYTTDRILNARRADAEKFLAAEIEGFRYAMNHRDETIRLTRKITGAKEDDPRPAFVFDKAVENKSIGTDLPIPLDKLNHMQTQLVSSGSLGRAIDLLNVIDLDVRDKALAIVGK